MENTYTTYIVDKMVIIYIGIPMIYNNYNI